MAMDFKRKLPVPAEVKQLYPLSRAAAEAKRKTDEEAAAVLRGESRKKLLIIGPCSADREDSVFEYCSRLKKIYEQVKNELVIIPRVYTGKPRSSGVGYRGMITQPDPNEKPDPFKGILSIRRMHTEILTELELSTADELLSPADYRYVSDLLSYTAVGARSVENQEHRLAASGLAVPVGMKNPINGDLTAMLNAVSTAQHAHRMIYRGWDVETSGNPLAHAILRGGIGQNGYCLPNYHYECLEKLCELYESKELLNPAFLVDANHSNSGKKYNEQPRICREVICSMKNNGSIAKLCKGFMVESYLVDGAQKIGTDEIPGCSITDPCLGWEKTESLILDIAQAVSGL